ncbi:MAG: hypothetical protein AMXMBFR47_11240 [Planctomycetota bacterium]
MKIRKILAAVVTLGLVAALAGAQESPPAEKHAEAKTVRVKAEGYNRDDATKRALRRALEQGAGVQIASFSNTENFALVRDTIYSRAFGIIKDFKVLKEEPGPGGTVEIEIEAIVRPDAVAQTWGEVQNLLDQLGRPKIMVLIDEHIDGELQKESIVASRIEQLFVKAGFDLVAPKAIAAIKSAEADDAAREKNEAKLAALAKDAGAHIFIHGNANANRSGLRDIYGTKAAYYNCDVQAKVFYTDTGKLIASESLPSTEAGVRSSKEYSPQAARNALVQATYRDVDAPGSMPPLANRIYESVMVQWSTMITAGGDIELEIEGIDFKNYVAVKRALTDFEGVKSVNGDFTKGIGKFRLKADLKADTLAEKLTEKPFSDYFEVVDLKLNRIQAKAVTRP